MQQMEAIKVVLMHEKHALSRKIGLGLHDLFVVARAWRLEAHSCKLQPCAHNAESMESSLANGYFEIHTAQRGRPPNREDCLIGV